jgi:3-hydroxyisobutyrate dehydrogenase
LLQPAGVEFLDCPVSGGVEGAQKATLAIMAGGTPEGFARAQAILAAMGSTVAHFGPIGSGQAAKATNQIMCAGIIEAVAEAMAFARAQGLPLQKLIETLGRGAGSSWYFVQRAPNMVQGSFPAGFRVRLHAKDLKICQEMAARSAATVPVVERMLAQYAELVSRGYGDEDISATFRLKAELFNPPDNSATATPDA